MTFYGCFINPDNVFANGSIMNQTILYIYIYI